MGQRIKGIFVGTVWGTLMGSCALVAVSLAMPGPSAATPPKGMQTDVALTERPEVDVATPEVIADARSQDEVAEEDPANPAPLDVAEADAVGTVETQEPPVPVVSAPTGEVRVPVLAPEVDQQVADAPEPVLPNPQSLAPQVPASEAEINIATHSATPSAEPVTAIVDDAPQVGVVTDPDAPIAPVPSEDVAVVVIEPSQAQDQEVETQTSALQEPVSTDDAPVVDLKVADTPVAVEEEANPITETAEADVPVLEEPTEPVTPDEEVVAAVEDAVNTDVIADPMPEVEVADVVPETPLVDEPVIETPDVVADAGSEEELVIDEPTPGPAAVVTSLVDGADALPGTGLTQDAPGAVRVVRVGDGALPGQQTGVVVNRFAGTDETPEADTQQEAEDDAAPTTAQSALERYAVKTTLRADTPRVSVVLMDDGQMVDAAGDLAALPFTVTVIVDPTRADASDLMTKYREAGLEIGLTTSLPVAATASDVAVSMEAALSQVPETTVFIDAGLVGLQNSRDIAGEVLAALAEDGRGLIVAPSGLNPALREADTYGVSAALIATDLDANGQDARVIARFLDRAAFDARQSPEGVVVLGRVRAETLDALAVWGEGNRASQVDLVPASTVLLSQ